MSATESRTPKSASFPVFPVDPCWYERYWLTERRPPLPRLRAALRRLSGILTVACATPALSAGRRTSSNGKSLLAAAAAVHSKTATELALLRKKIHEAHS
jgi:hypothetical protein